MSGRLCLAAVGGFVSAVRLCAQDPEAGIANWPAPLYWSTGDSRPSDNSTSEGTVRIKSVPTSPVPFIGITPCRVVDTRDPNKPPGYGPPALSPGVANGRTFVLTGQCGITADDVQAVSLNITVTNTLGAGYIVLYPQDGTFPPVSTLNYGVGQTIANAAVVPLGTGGAIRVVAGVSGTDLIIDTNGYYAPSGTPNPQNTAVGVGALASNTLGNNNTAFGFGTLFSNIEGGQNIAVGNSALTSNTYGNANTAVGWYALQANTTGTGNTAFGFRTLYSANGGANNTALGANAGVNLVTGDDNLYLGNEGVDGESDTIRIGSGGAPAHTRTFVAAVRGVTTGRGDAVPVMIDSASQLGTVSSSARFKESVQDMDDASSALMNLRPVTFRYKGQASDRTQFGLIAEEVESVLPDLVVCDGAGEAETVLYHELPAMLLNELQKLRKEIERLQARLASVEAAGSEPRDAR